MPDDMAVQIPYIKDITRAFNLPIYEKSGFEADDLIGSVARIAEEQGLSVVMVTGDKDFKRVATEVLRYVKQDMTSPEGAFYSATDADSLTPEGHLEEGYFFTWTPGWT